MKDSHQNSKKKFGDMLDAVFNNQWIMLGLGVSMALGIVLTHATSGSRRLWWQLIVIWELRLAAVIYGLVILVILGEFVSERVKGKVKADTVREFRSALMVVIPMAIASAVDHYSQSILPFLTKIFGLYGMRLVIFSSTIGFGVIAHRWKRKDQLSYGMGEVLFACLATGYIAFRILPGQSILSQWVALGGGAYVVARGLNNMVEAKKQRSSLVAGNYALPHSDAVSNTR